VDHFVLGPRTAGKLAAGSCREWPAETGFPVLRSRSGGKAGVEQFGSVPPNVLVRPWVPQLFVLSRASLFLTRCGMNSVTESLFYGVPMLLFPKIVEQQLVAREASQAGAGVILNERHLKAADLRREAERVLHAPEFQQAAQRLGDSLRSSGGYQKAAELILSHRARH
jgi:MGT family glycosyltransferase